MMVAYAGRLTPHAKVAVVTKTLMLPFKNKDSVSSQSDQSIPAL